LLRGPLRWLSWTFAFAGVITVSATVGATLALLTPFQLSAPSETAKNVDFGNFFKTGFQYGVSRPVNILVMGIDQGLDTDATERAAHPLQSRSDTMLLVRLNPESHKTSLLTIPRDTQVEIPGLGTNKINAANWKGGPELAAEVVSQTLNGVAVDRYVRISTDAFTDLVDVVGGVEIFVPQRMQYDDNTQKLHIDLQPGLQTLNGQQAEGFVRFRHDDLGDIGRTQRQQMLLKALQKKFQNPLMLARLPQVFSVLQKHIDSNLSLGEMLALVQFGIQIKPDQLQMVMLPGRFSTPDEFELSYWLMDRTATDRVMQTYFDVDLPVESEVSTTAPISAADISVVVQNASGNPDGGNLMADYLQKLGYANVSVDNDWPEPLDRTQVVPQWGNLGAAQELSQKLERSDVTADSTGNLRSDLTIRVGRDWVRQQPPVP
jgi:LCP family protein required for cell wall assembly